MLRTLRPNESQVGESDNLHCNAIQHGSGEKAEARVGKYAVCFGPMASVRSAKFKTQTTMKFSRSIESQCTLAS